jgi:hypothetical protein
MAKAKAKVSKNARFEMVNLAFNVGGLSLGDMTACNPGGSVICPSGSGCPPGTCVGASCSGKSATLELGFESRILVAKTHLAKLQAEIQAVVAKYQR